MTRLGYHYLIAAILSTALLFSFMGSSEAASPCKHDLTSVERIGVSVAGLTVHKRDRFGATLAIAVPGDADPSELDRGAPCLSCCHGDQVVCVNAFALPSQIVISVPDSSRADLDKQPDHALRPSHIAPVKEPPRAVL